MRLLSLFYRLARTSRDVETVERMARTGNPAYLARRLSTLEN